MGKSRKRKDRGKQIVATGPETEETEVVGSDGRNSEQPQEREKQQLLPGILNEITLDWIVPKLPWRVLFVLSAVSRNWRQARHRRDIYNARVRHSVTNTFVVHDHHEGTDKRRIGVYSIADKCCYELPRMPKIPRGIPWGCRLISLNGRLYVLGGELLSQKTKVHVLDLAGRGQWKRCASMPEARDNSGCGVVDGKIYVCGRSYPRGFVEASQMFEPKLDTWSSVSSLVSGRLSQIVSTLGEKLIDHGGERFRRSIKEWLANKFSVVYDHGKKTWTVGSPYFDGWGILFEAKGKLHYITHRFIFVYDDNDESWEQLHLNRFPRVQVTGSLELSSIEPRAVTCVEDELFLRVLRNVPDDVFGGENRPNWHYSIIDEASVHGSPVLQSKGFGSKSAELVWHTVSICQTFYDQFMCSIEL